MPQPEIWDDHHRYPANVVHAAIHAIEHSKDNMVEKLRCREPDLEPIVSRLSDEFTKRVFIGPMAPRDRVDLAEEAFASAIYSGFLLFEEIARQRHVAYLRKAHAKDSEVEGCGGEGQ